MKLDRLTVKMADRFEVSRYREKPWQMFCDVTMITLITFAVTITLFCYVQITRKQLPKIIIRNGLRCNLRM